MLYLCIQIDFSSGFRAIHQIPSFHHFFLWRRAVVLISRQVASPAVVIRSSGGPPVTVTSTSTEKVQVLYRRLSHVRQQWMRRRSSVVGDLEPVIDGFGVMGDVFSFRIFWDTASGMWIFFRLQRGVISGNDSIFLRNAGDDFSRWWFQRFLIFTPTWGNDQIWLIFFRWVETTDQITLATFSGTLGCFWLFNTLEEVVLPLESQKQKHTVHLLKKSVTYLLHSDIWKKDQDDLWLLESLNSMCDQDLNSHYLRMNRGWENQLNSRGLYTQYKDFLLKVGWVYP